MTVVYRGANALAHYWSCDGVTVRRGSHPERPYACLTCIANDCEHIDAVIEHVTTHGIPEPREAA